MGKETIDDAPNKILIEHGKTESIIISRSNRIIRTINKRNSQEERS